MSNNDADKTQHSGRTGEFDISDMTDEEAEKARAKKRDAQLKDESGWSEWGNDAWGKGKGGGGGKGAGGTWGKDERWTGDKPSAPAAKSNASAGNRTEAFFIGDGVDHAGDNAIELKTDNRKYKIGAKGGKSGGKGGWNEDWDDADGGGGGGSSTMALNLNDIQTEAAKPSAPVFQRGSYNPGQAEDNSTYRAGHFQKAGGRNDDIAPTSKKPGGRGGFSDEPLDDPNGWSPGQLVDANAAKIPKAPANMKGADATAAIDVASFLGEDRNATVPLDAKQAAAIAAADAQRAHLIIFAPDSTDAVVFEIRRDTINIGRDFSNDVVLSDPYTSQKHVMIHKRQGFYEVEDAGTVNGTMVNGHFITRARLQHGDHVEIGATILRFVPGVPSVQDRIPSSAPQRQPVYTAPPPKKGQDGGVRSPMMLILVATLIMIVIAAGVIAVLWAMME